TPALIDDGSGGLHALRREVGKGAIKVVTHQIDVVRLGVVRRVNAELGGRQGEDEPSVTGVDVRQLEDVAKEGPDGVRLGGVDERVNSGDHVSWARCE